MSISSKSRKESTDSYASQRSNNVMGVPSELAQTYDRELNHELPSRKADSSDIEPTDVQPIDTEPNNQADTLDDTKRWNQDGSAVEVTDTDRELDADLNDLRMMDDNTSRRNVPPTDAEVEEARRASWGQDKDPETDRRAELGHS